MFRPLTKLLTLKHYHCHQSSLLRNHENALLLAQNPCCSQEYAASRHVTKTAVFKPDRQSVSSIDVLHNGCVTLAHRTSAHHFFGTSAHQYPDICSSIPGHLLIKIRTSAHQNPDICSSNFRHLLPIYRKVKVCLQDMSRVI